jgi:hypothetical protein
MRSVERRTHVFFQDESGRNDTWAFVIAMPTDPQDLVSAVRAWRKEFHSKDRKGKAKKNTSPQEYHDSHASAQERRFLLTQLGHRPLSLYAAVKLGYKPSWEYPYVIASLLQLAGVSDGDRVFLDEKDNHKRRKQATELITGLLGMSLEISWWSSTQYKEIQACDALAGCIIRSYLNESDSGWDVVEPLLAKPVLVLPEDQYFNLPNNKTSRPR